MINLKLINIFVIIIIVAIFAGNLGKFLGNYLFNQPHSLKEAKQIISLHNCKNITDSSGPIFMQCNAAYHYIKFND